MAAEDFTSRASNGGSAIIKDIIFGCSVESSEDFFRHSDKIAGILGMGRGPQSIVTQLGNNIRHRFSYCLLPYDHKGFTFLRFGNDIKVGRGAQRTPFVPHPIPVFYFVNLMDITVNGARLHFPPGTFAIHPDGTGGCLVDTGAPYTVLIGQAYEVVARVAADHFARYNLTMVSGEDYELGLCYRMPLGFRDFPSMTFHFQNADLRLGTQHLFMIDHWKLVFCLMMVPDRNISILGAAQMVNMQFIFDVEAKQLTFAPHDCTAQS